MATTLFTSLQMDNGDQPNLWDSLDSDTESLAQEKAHLMDQQRQKHKKMSDKTKYSGMEEGFIYRQKEEVNKEENIEDEEEDEEDEYIYDSLDMADGKENRELPNTEVQVDRMKDEDISRQNGLKDEYADLRYDPNWRNTFEGAQFFDERNHHPQMDKECHHSDEEFGGDLWGVSRRAMTLEKKDISVSRHVPTVAFKMETASESLLPKSKVSTTPHPLAKQQQSRTRPKSQTFEHQRSSPALDQGMGDSDGRNGSLMKSRKDSDAEPVHFSEPGVTIENSNSGYPGHQDHSADSKTAKNCQNGILPKIKPTHYSPTVKEASPKQGIVEQNKKTLGVTGHKQGSYLWTYKQRGGNSYTKKKILEPGEDVSHTSSQRGQDGVLDVEHQWQRKTKELKQMAQGYNNRKFQKPEKQRHKVHAKKGGPLGPLAAGDRQRRSENPEAPERHHIPSTRGDRPRHDEVLLVDDVDPSNSSGTSWLSAPPGPHQTATLNWNFGLKAPADAGPLLDGDPPWAGLAPCFLWSPPWATELAVCQPPPMNPHFDQQRASPRMPSFYCPRVVPHSGQPASLLPLTTCHPAPGQHNLGGRLLYRDDGRMGCYGAAWFLTRDASSAQKMALSRPRIVSMKQAGERDREPNPGHAPVSAGSYQVLPPIHPTAGGDAELSGQRAGQQVYAIRRTSSEGYLAQMEKQKQLKERMGYKAYTLKDYKSLQKDVKLGGLGPDYKLTEIIAEKMRRQKRYSDAVREQNQKIERKPPQPERPPMGCEDKGMLPRRKALEYAKNIPKPKLPPQLKKMEAGMKESFTEHARYLEDLDVSQLATLEILQKRHEEEKKAVAHFRPLHAV